MLRFEQGLRNRWLGQKDVNHVRFLVLFSRSVALALSKSEERCRQATRSLGLGAALAPANEEAATATAHSALVQGDSASPKASSP
jgi:hypothetical protein